MYEAKIKKKISYSIETIEKIVKSRRLFYINLTLSFNAPMIEQIQLDSNRFAPRH